MAERPAEDKSGILPERLSSFMEYRLTGICIQTFI